MNKFKLYFVVISVTFVLFSCTDSDSSNTVPIRAYSDQYVVDKIIIENYLTTYYLENTEFSDNQEIKISKITKDDGSQLSIYSLLNSSTYPKLLIKEVTSNGVEYDVYYLKLRADNDVDGKAPSKVDEVLTAYEGSYLTYSSTIIDSISTIDIVSTVFETVLFPQNTIPLDSSIKGWTEILPLFKSGSYDTTTPSSDPAVFLNYGAGVVFLPSGLAYFNESPVSSSIPEYSVIQFTFKLNDVKRIDHDGDGILSIDEDLNGDGDFTNDDTDGDGIQNYKDIDDDGDGYLTKNEIKNEDGETYSFDAIPDCSGNSTDPKRNKRHLDNTCYKD